MLAPFYIAATDGGFDGTLDIPQHITAALADRRTQCIDSIRGRKIVNCLKIVPVKITLWFKTAPFQNGVHDADCGGTLELEFLSGIIIIHQERPVNDGEDVCAVVVPVGFCQLSGNVRNLLAEPFMVNAVFLRQHFRYRLEQVIVATPPGHGNCGALRCPTHQTHSADAGIRWIRPTGRCPWSHAGHTGSCGCSRCRNRRRLWHRVAGRRS